VARKSYPEIIISLLLKLLLSKEYILLLPEIGSTVRQVY